MNQTWETREVVQESEEARALESEGWKYYRTFHNSDKRSVTYGKRIDIYRKEHDHDGAKNIYLHPD